jgi:hypothetical protein
MSLDVLIPIGFVSFVCGIFGTAVYWSIPC